MARHRAFRFGWDLGRVVGIAAVLLALVGTAACASPAAAPPRAAPTTAPAAAAPAPMSGSAPSPTDAAPAAPPAPSISVRIPYTAVSVVNAPLWVAKEAGDFEQEGVSVEVEYIATSTTVTQSMLSGEIALANSGLESLVTATLAGAELVGLAATTDRFIFRLYGAPGLSTLNDLRGKRVAVTRLGTSTDTVARLLLQRNGLEPDRDLTIIQVGGVPEIFAALQSGAADGGILSPPTIFRADAAGFVMLADTTQTEIPFHQAVLMSTRRYVAENADAVRRVLRGYMRGIARYKQDKAFAKEMIGRYTRTDDEYVLEQTWAIEDRVLARVPYLRAEAVQLALELAAPQYPEARSRSPRDFYDDRLLRELEESGFIGGLYR
jgi:NitT/TauT family transport system substrate-binding protein